MSLAPQTRALLDRAKPGFEPSALEARAAEAALLAAIGVTTGVGAAAAGASLSAAKLASGGSILVKLAFGLAIVSAGIAGVAVLARSPAVTSTAPPSLTLATSAATAPPVTTTEPPPITTEPRAEPEVRAAPPKPVRPLAVVAEAPAASVVAAPAEASTLPEEIAIVRDGTTRLHAGDGAGALAAFDAHARAFPHGVLEEERSAGRVLALCALGRVAEAQAQRDVLRADHPASAHAARIRESCAGPW